MILNWGPSTCWNRIWWIFSAWNWFCFVSWGERSSWDLSTEFMECFNQSLPPYNTELRSLNLLKQNLVNLLCLKLILLCELMWENLMRLHHQVRETFRRINFTSECCLKVLQLAETELGESSLVGIDIAFRADVREPHRTSSPSSWHIFTNQFHLRMLSQGPSTCCNKIWWIFSAWNWIRFVSWGDRSSWDLSTESMKHFDQPLSPQNAGSSSLNLL